MHLHEENPKTYVKMCTTIHPPCRTTDKRQTDRQTDRQVKWHDESRSQWLEYRLRYAAAEASAAEAAAMQQPRRPLARPTVRQQPDQGGSTVGHALRAGNRRNFLYFSIWHRDYGRQGIQKGLHGSEDRYIPADQFGCDRSIVVGCRSWNDRQTSRQTSRNDNKAHSLRT